MTAQVDMTEMQLQYAVTDLATLRGWLWYHTHDSRRSPAGFPDLVLVKGARLLFVELKTQTGKTRPGQKQWMLALEQVARVVAKPIQHGAPETGVEVHLWRPEHLRDGTIAKALR